MVEIGLALGLIYYAHGESTASAQRVFVLGANLEIDGVDTPAVGGTHGTVFRRGGYYIGNARLGDTLDIT